MRKIIGCSCRSRLLSDRHDWTINSRQSPIDVVNFADQIKVITSISEFARRLTTSDIADDVACYAATKQSAWLTGFIE